MLLPHLLTHRLINRWGVVDEILQQFRSPSMILWLASSWSSLIQFMKRSPRFKLEFIRAIVLSWFPNWWLHSNISQREREKMFREKLASSSLLVVQSSSLSKHNFWCRNRLQWLIKSVLWTSFLLQTFFMRRGFRGSVRYQAEPNQFRKPRR